MKKKILLFTPSFKLKNLHFNKDIVIIPTVFAKEKNMDFFIISKNNENNFIKNKNISHVISNTFIWNILEFIRIRPDILFTVHLSHKVFLYILLFKIISKKTKIILKMDWEDIIEIKSFLKRKILNLLFYLIDIITIESKKWLDFLQSNYKKNKTKFFYLPNWYYPKQYIKYKYDKKENIIITAWRIWTYQKDTELFLEIVKEVLKKIDNYKVYLLWPIKKEFKFYIKRFFKKNPELKTKIFFKWNIKNRNELFEYYKKSKFFLLSSRFDITPNVLCESGYFWNIIVSTNIWWADEITNNSQSWFVFKKENYKSASKFIIDNINSKKTEIMWLESTLFIQKNFNYINFINKIYKSLK